MRILYKTLASVGMILLSTAAAFGIRHIKLNNQKRAKSSEPSPDLPKDNVQEEDDSLKTKEDESLESNESPSEIKEESSDDSHEVAGD